MILPRRFLKSFLKEVSHNIRNFTVTRNTRSILSLNSSQKSLSITFENEENYGYHYHWLRDHCRCKQCFNSNANERMLNTLGIPLQIKPKEINVINGNLSVKWPDDHVSYFESSWLQKNHYGQPCHAFLADQVDRVYWNHTIKDNIPSSLLFDDVISKDDSLFSLLETIEKYGFGIVSSTPTESKSMRKLGQRIGIIHDNLYGDGVWILTNQSTEENLKDMAYLNVALNAHHDGTFSAHPPGLQAFNCCEHTGKGGETLLVDGISAAYQLKKRNINAFNYLSTVSIPALYEDPGFYVRNFEPIIKCDPVSQKIYQVRINENHRDVLSNLKFDEVETFYEALHEFLSIIRSEDNAFWLKLTPGNCLIVDNWRVLHGRAAFTGKRTLIGFYIEKEDYMSKLKLLQRKFCK